VSVRPAAPAAPSAARPEPAGIREVAVAPSLRRPLLALLMAPTIGVWLALTAGSAAAVDASTAPIDIDFEQDVPGGYPAGFMSADSSLLSFDTVAYPGTGNCTEIECGTADGVTVNMSRGANDSQAVTTHIIGVPQAIRINFVQPTQRVSLLIGDADQQPAPGQTLPSAVLTGFFDGTRIASVSVQGDNDGLADQTLNLQGFIVNSAVVQWTEPDGTTPRSGWPEMVDNVHSDPLCSVFGNNAANTLDGTADIDVICGGPSADTINGFGDHDLLYGNTGADTINAGFGMDQMFGGTGFDTCRGGPGTDTANSCESRTSVP
jgi:hypothetical protein